MDKNKIETEQVREAIEKNMAKVRNTALISGAKMICGQVFEIITKHLEKHEKASLRDYQRMTDEIYKFITVPLSKDNEEKFEAALIEQFDLEENNDGTAE